MENEENSYPLFSSYVNLKLCSIYLFFMLASNLFFTLRTQIKIISVSYFNVLVFSHTEIFVDFSACGST